jgi:hypothetical protein
VEDALGLLHGDLARLHAAVLLLLVVQEHDLADVLARLHELERLLDLVHREGRHRQAVVVALHEVPAHLAADLGGHGGVVQGQAVHVDGEERDVLAERQQAQAVVLEDVHLADLEEAARRAQGLDAQALVLARQRVQHDIDSQAVRVAHQVIEPRRGARVVHVLHAHGPHQLALVGRPRRGVDHRAEVLADGDGRVADTTRSAVDQHLLALSDARQVDQRVVRGVVDRLQRRRVLEGHALVDLHHAPGRGVQAVGEAAGLARHYAVADLEVGDVAAHSRHDTRRLQAQVAPVVRALVRLLGQQAQRDHHVTEVERRGVDVHRHLVITRGGHRARAEGHADLARHGHAVVQVGEVARAVRGLDLGGARVDLVDGVEARHQHLARHHGVRLLTSIRQDQVRHLLKRETIHLVRRGTDACLCGHR